MQTTSAKIEALNADPRYIALTDQAEVLRGDLRRHAQHNFSAADGGYQRILAALNTVTRKARDIARSYGL